MSAVIKARPVGDMPDGPLLTFDDHKPEGLSLYDAVVEGLSRTEKAIPPKFFYDEVGSELFDAICAQPEYYVPEVERRMLVERADEIAALTGTGRVLIEPGAGSLAKARLLLDALKPAAFVPMDISCDYLRTMAHELVNEYPWLPVHAACVDFTHSMPVPSAAPGGERLCFFPGSSLGNFDPSEAQGFLSMVAETVGGGGMLLIGVDTKKSDGVLNAAYNDAAGVTARFNLNLLHRMRRELDTDIDPECFEHMAFYNADAGRIEMHLVSRAEQSVRVDGRRFELRAGETVHTECSYKYAPEEFLDLAANAGFRPVRHWLGDGNLFAIYLLEVA
ncbi:MAG: L-histidine N(alpha)-methyltransferase [Gammaproteobacteria bacterium]